MVTDVNETYYDCFATDTNTERVPETNIVFC